MVLTLTNPDLPTLSPDDHALLLRYISHQENLHALSAELAAAPAAPSPDSGLTTQDPAAESPSPVHLLTSSPVHSPRPDFLTLLTWTASPHIAPYIALYRNHISHLDRREAIETLKAVIATSDDPIEKRRAASSMLRLLTAHTPSAPRDKDGPPPRNSRPADSGPRTKDSGLDPDPDDDLIDQADDELSDEPDPDPWTPYQSKSTYPVVPIAEAYADKPGQIDSPPFAPLPDPTRQPTDVAHIILAAVQAPDSPTDGAGHRILFNHQGYIRDRSLAAFKEYSGNYLANVLRFSWGFKSSEITSTVIEPTRARITAILTLHDQTQSKMDLQLERIPAGTLKDCWVIKHFYTTRLKPQPNTS